MDATEEIDGRKKAKFLQAMNKAEKKMVQKRPMEIVLVLDTNIHSKCQFKEAK